ncbi:osmotically inducible protein OsmC [Streptomyces sp. AS58]|uniref:OsmC family protein n=1 Tax=Streptomyces sp. AS58 TaxID=1519489 RepID=UPI0006AE65D3|nr:OsmC family protein [Streptomyces sp. AS58]KOV53586.1 osmotically inducible protein OsmC [Streptomyces sp. AS58]
MTGTTPHNTSESRKADVHRLDVAHAGGDAYTVEVRGHRIHVDQPSEAGGRDTAPTPTELFAASLATCVAFYAGSFLHRHGLPRSGLRGRAEFVMVIDRPARVASVRIMVVPPPELPDERRAAPLAVASHCTVHNTLEQSPKVGIELVS